MLWFRTPLRLRRLGRLALARLGEWVMWAVE
jgi:hypothetical protein